MTAMRSGWMMVLFLWLAIVLAACTDSEVGEEPTSSDDETTTTAAEEGGAMGGELVVGIGVDVSSLDPHAGTTGQDPIWLWPMMDSLFALDEDSNAVAQLVTDWSYSGDSTELTLSLREGVTFSDGAPFDSAAVKMNIERAQGEETSTAPELASIESIETPDELTVILQLSRPDTSLPNVLAERAGIMISPPAIEAETVATNPVGVGAFRFVSHTPGGELVMERNPDYWDADNVKLDSLRIQFLERATLARAVTAGEVDYASQLEASAIEGLESAGDVEWTPLKTVRFYQLYIDTTREPMDDITVRRAISFAVNREQLVEAMTFGYGEPATQIFPPGYWAFSEEASQEVGHDPEEAQRLLDDAGVDELELVVAGGSTPTDNRRIDILREQLAEYGLTIDYRPGDPRSVVSGLGGHEYDLVSFPWTGRSDPSATFRALFLSQSPFQPADPSSIPGYDYERALELVNGANAEQDPDARAQLFANAAYLVSPAEAALSIPLYVDPVIEAWKTGVSGFVIPEARGLVNLKYASISE